MTAQLPSPSVPFVDMATGRMTAPWAQFFFNLSQATNPAPIDDTLGATGEFTASQSGFWYVSGTPSGVVLTRARKALNLGAYSGFVPAANGDVLAVNGSGGVTFIPAGP